MQRFIFNIFFISVVALFSSLNYGAASSSSSSSRTHVRSEDDRDDEFGFSDQYERPTKMPRSQAYDQEPSSLSSSSSSSSSSMPLGGQAAAATSFENDFEVQEQQGGLDLLLSAIDTKEKDDHDTLLLAIDSGDSKQIKQALVDAKNPQLLNAPEFILYIKGLIRDPIKNRGTISLFANAGLIPATNVELLGQLNNAFIKIGIKNVSHVLIPRQQLEQIGSRWLNAALNITDQIVREKIDLIGLLAGEMQNESEIWSLIKMPQISQFALQNIVILARKAIGNKGPLESSIGAVKLLPFPVEGQIAITDIKELFEAVHFLDIKAEQVLAYIGAAVVQWLNEDKGVRWDELNALPHEALMSASNCLIVARRYLKFEFNRFKLPKEAVGPSNRVDSAPEIQVADKPILLEVTPGGAHMMVSGAIARKIGSKRLENIIKTANQIDRLKNRLEEDRQQADFLTFRTSKLLIDFLHALQEVSEGAREVIEKRDKEGFLKYMRNASLFDVDQVSIYMVRDLCKKMHFLAIENIPILGAFGVLLLRWAAKDPEARWSELNTSVNGARRIMYRSFMYTKRLMPHEACSFEVSVQDLINWEKLGEIIRPEKYALEDCLISSLAGLENLPGAENVQYLYLKKNCIKNVPDYAFAHFPNLEELRLDENNIVHIGQNALAGLNKLRYLNLENNNLSELNPLIFKETQNLERLNFDNNPIMKNKQKIQVIREKIRSAVGKEKLRWK